MRISTLLAQTFPCLLFFPLSPSLLLFLPSSLPLFIVHGGQKTVPESLELEFQAIVSRHMWFSELNSHQLEEKQASAFNH